MRVPAEGMRRPATQSSQQHAIACRYLHSLSIVLATHRSLSDVLRLERSDVFHVARRSRSAPYSRITLSSTAACAPVHSELFLSVQSCEPLCQRHRVPLGVQPRAFEFFICFVAVLSAPPPHALRQANVSRAYHHHLCARARGNLIVSSRGLGRG